MLGKKVWSLGLVVLLAVSQVVAGCSSQSQPAQSQPSQSQPAKGGSAGGKQLTVEEIANYKGQDREQFLIEGAKREGALSIYSSMNAVDSKPLVDAFQKKYPFVKVNLFAGLGEEVTTRVTTEQRNKNYTADTFDAPTVNVEKLRREGFLTSFYTPAQDVYPKDHISKENLWVPIYHNILTLVYNTNEVKDPPKTYQDLLDPKWKGKMALEDTDETWMINLWQSWGENKARDYFKSLGQQGLRIVHGHSVLMQSLITGEIAMTPTQYLHQAIAQKKKGAPIDFVLMDPMIDMPEGLSLLKTAPHPYSAMLYIDFATSEEAQVLINGRGRNAAYPGVDQYLQKAKLVVDDAKVSLDKFQEWEKLYDQLLLAPNKKG